MAFVVVRTAILPRKSRTTAKSQKLYRKGVNLMVRIADALKVVGDFEGRGEEVEDWKCGRLWYSLNSMG